MIEYDFEGYAKSKIDKGLGYLEGFSKGYHQAKSEWVDLMRGVRVEKNSVIITVNGGNDEARFLCKELINEMAIYKEKT